jgi:hypothetical protein
MIGLKRRIRVSFIADTEDCEDRVVEYETPAQKTVVRTVEKKQTGQARTKYNTRKDMGRGS